jgi:acetyl esterase/lipase
LKRLEIRWRLREYMNLVPLWFRILRSNRKYKQTSRKRISFGRNNLQHVLYFEPGGAQPEKSHVIFFIPGGGWRMGNPEQYSFVGRFFSQQGYHTFLLGYRLVPRFQFPHQIDDIELGVKECLAFLKKKGIAGKGIIIGGQSAGAQLAALLSYGYAKTRALPRIKGVYLISGPLDFSLCRNKTVRKFLRDYIDMDSDWAKADPIRYVTGKEPFRALLVHGTHDPLVDISATASFYKKSNKKTTRFLKVSRAHHADLVGIFLDPLAKAASDVLKWIKSFEEAAPFTRKAGFPSRR